MKPLTFMNKANALDYLKNVKGLMQLKSGKFFYPSKDDESEKGCFYDVLETNIGWHIVKTINRTTFFCWFDGDKLRSDR